MTAPSEDAGDSSPLAPPVGGSNEPQDARLAEVLERSNLLLGALRLSDSSSDSPVGTSLTINTTLLRRRRHPEEAEEAKEERGELRETAQTDTASTTAGTSTTLPEAVPDNPGTPSSPNDPHPSNDSEITGPFYVDLIDEDDLQRRRPMPRRRPRSRERSDDIMAVAQESNAADGGDTTTATTSMPATELLAPRVSERHVSAFYPNIMAQVYLLEEQEGTRPRHNNNNNNNNNNGPNRRINTRGARGA